MFCVESTQLLMLDLNETYVICVSVLWWLW